MLKPQPDLNGNPFYGWKSQAKRLGVEGGNSCHNYINGKDTKQSPN